MRDMEIELGDSKPLKTFQQRSLRRILGVRWQERITNQEVLRLARQDYVARMVEQRRWRYLGHAMRTKGHPYVSLGWAPEGTRRMGRPKDTWRRVALKRLAAAGMKSWRRPPWWRRIDVNGRVLAKMCWRRYMAKAVQQNKWSKWSENDHCDSSHYIAFFVWCPNHYG